MCGRYSIYESMDHYLRELAPEQLVINGYDLCPIERYNVAPSTRVELIPASDRDTAVSQLPLGCSSPEDLLRSLGELTRWVQNNIAGGGAGAEPVIEERPVPSQDARHLRPEMLELAGWIGRSGT